MLIEHSIKLTIALDDKLIQLLASLLPNSKLTEALGEMKAKTEALDAAIKGEKK